MSLCPRDSCFQLLRPQGHSDLGELQEGHSPISIFISLLHCAVSNALQLLFCHLYPNHQPEYLEGGGRDDYKEEVQELLTPPPNLVHITPKVINNFIMHPSSTLHSIPITSYRIHQFPLLLHHANPHLSLTFPHSPQQYAQAHYSTAISEPSLHPSSTPLSNSTSSHLSQSFSVSAPLTFGAR